MSTQRDNPKQTEGVERSKGRIEKLLFRNLIEGKKPPPRYVLFIDMLRFGALTEPSPSDRAWFQT